MVRVIAAGSPEPILISPETISSVSFANVSLGSIITNLISLVEPGFKLDPPWDFLNDLDLSGLSMTIALSKAAGGSSVSLTYTHAIDLFFIKICPGANKTFL